MIALGWIDTLRMVWWWGSKGNWKLPMPAEDVPGYKILPLISGDWSHKEMLAGGTWGTVKSLINKAKRMSENNGFRLVRADIEALEPGTALPFTTSLKDEALVYVPLHCHHPKLMLYEDAATASLLPGQVWVVGANTLKRTVANYGEVQSVCLVLTLRKEPEE